MATTDRGTPGQQPPRQRQYAQWLAFYLGDEALKGELGRATLSNARLAEVVEAGLPVAAADWLRQRSHMSAKQFGKIIPRSTLESRRKSGEQALSVEQSGRVMRVAEIYARAAEVFGDHERAEQWMKRTNPGMPHGRTPAEMLLTSYGARHVDDVLTRLEHGIPA